MTLAKKFLLFIVCCMALFTPSNDLHAAVKSRSRTLTNKQLYIGGAIIVGAITATLVTRMLWKRGWFSKRQTTPTSTSSISSIRAIASLSHTLEEGRVRQYERALVRINEDPQACLAEFDAAERAPANPQLPVINIKEFNDPRAYIAKVLRVYPDDNKGVSDNKHLEKALTVLLEALKAGTIPHFKDPAEEEQVINWHRGVVARNLASKRYYEELHVLKAATVAN